MSIRVMSQVWEAYPGGGSELLALLALADWSDDNGKCYPSMASISKKIRLKPRQAKRIVHQLIDDGFVQVVGNEFGGSPGSSRQYRLILSRLTGVAHDTRRSVSDDTPTPETGVMQGIDGCHGRPETGVTHDTLTVIEPSRTVRESAQARLSSQKGGKKKKPITLDRFLETCKASGEQVIPGDDPIFEYADAVGIDHAMIAAAWHVFKDTYRQSDKLYADWRRTFRNSVRGNWKNLWFIREGEQAKWTTTGMQAKREMEA
ncbi:MAG: hypothetical protein GZ085_11190 [Sulfuriferula multivorans]|uniref:Helix-turn-helix domain-containing protein n=1 Tax=Sulfuriferula multivorans TaxID=1559896 RepID=A0A7C9TCD6_9PROT|nr:hypothetical protein [Sulfuriferula multivorans]